MINVFYMKVEMNNTTKVFWVLVVGVSSAYLLNRGKATEQLALPSPKPQEVVKPITPKLKKPKSYTESLKIAQEFKKPIVFVFSTDSCYWCDKLKSETLSNKKVKETLEDYVYFEVRYEKNKNVCQRYGVSVFPSYRIVEYIDDQEIIVKSGSGFKSPDNFIQWIVLERGVK